MRRAPRLAAGLFQRRLSRLRHPRRLAARSCSRWRRLRSVRWRATARSSPIARAATRSSLTAATASTKSSAHLERRGWRARLLVHTHAHIDHIGDLGALRERTSGGRPVASRRSSALSNARDASALDRPSVRAAGRFARRRLARRRRARGRNRAHDVLHTPGHTPGSVCLAVPDGNATTILSGDTLFAGSIGRWDLGGTSMEDIVRSIETKLCLTTTRPGHPRPRPFTTIGIERKVEPIPHPTSSS